MKKPFYIILALIALLAAASNAAASGADAVRAQIERVLSEGSPWGSSIEVSEISLGGFDESIAFDDIEVMLPKSSRNIGKVPVQVRLFNRGHEVKGFWATARVNAYREAVVALKPLKMNSVVTKSDVKIVRTEVRQTEGAITSVEEAEGMLVKRPIPAGSVIKKDFIKPRLVVKRGDRVVLLISNEKLRIKSRAVAVEDGSVGATVTVRTNSGREMSARVTGPGELTVEF